MRLPRECSQETCKDFSYFSLYTLYLYKELLRSKQLKVNRSSESISRIVYSKYLKSQIVIQQSLDYRSGYRRRIVSTTFCMTTKFCWTSLRARRRFIVSLPSWTLFPPRTISRCRHPSPAYFLLIVYYHLPKHLFECWIQRFPFYIQISSPSKYSPYFWAW